MVFTGASCYRSPEIRIRYSGVFTLFYENKVHIKFYETKNDSDLTQKVKSGMFRLPWFAWFVLLLILVSSEFWNGLVETIRE